MCPTQSQKKKWAELFIHALSIIHTIHHDICTNSPIIMMWWCYAQKFASFSPVWFQTVAAAARFHQNREQIYADSGWGGPTTEDRSMQIKPTCADHLQQHMNSKRGTQTLAPASLWFMNMFSVLSVCVFGNGVFVTCVARKRATFLSPLIAKVCSNLYLNQLRLQRKSNDIHNLPLSRRTVSMSPSCQL